MLIVYIWMFAMLLGIALVMCADMGMGYVVFGIFLILGCLAIPALFFIEHMEEEKRGRQALEEKQGGKMKSAKQFSSQLRMVHGCFHPKNFTSSVLKKR